MKALSQHVGGTRVYALHCPRAAPTNGGVACTYQHWFEAFSQRRRYCQLTVSGVCRQQFLQFRLVVIGCQLCLAVSLGASMLPELEECAHIVVEWLWQMHGT